MFKRESMLNDFLVGYFERVVKDIPADRISERPAGNGHPPIWVLGHLGLCAELGESLCGFELTHADWMPVFGPGSTDQIPNAGDFTKEQLVALTVDGYPRFRQRLAASSDDAMNQPHGLELLSKSPIQTKGDLAAHLLTTHFAFHLSQLSGWRRADGKPALF